MLGCFFVLFCFVFVCFVFFLFFFLGGGGGEAVSFLSPSFFSYLIGSLCHSFLLFFFFLDLFTCIEEDTAAEKMNEQMNM